MDPSPTTKVFDAASSSSRCCPSGWPLSSSASEAFSRSRDRRPQQELLRLQVVARQHLLDEVLDDGMVVTAEVGGPAPRLAAGEEQGRETEPCRPPLRAVDEQLGVSRAEHHAVAAQEGGRVGRGEGEVGRADLPELTGQPQPVQGQHRVGPGEQHEPQLVHRDAHQGGDGRDHRRVVDQVEVVEHEDHGLGEGGHPGHEPAQDLVLATEAGEQVARGLSGATAPEARRAPTT